MNDPIVIDGRISHTLDVRDRGLAYGHGVFETMRLWRGGLPLWSYHEQRLVRGLAVLGIPFPEQAIGESLAVLLATGCGDGVVKLTVTAGVSGRGYGVQAPLQPVVIAQWSALPSVAGAPLVLAVSDYRLPLNPALAGIKHLNRLDQVLAAASARDGQVPLLLDARGCVVEALSHNVFVRSGDRWLTPDLDQCGIAGVMRAVLLEQVFAELGVGVSVSTFGLEVVTSADEVFICNSVVGVQAVAAVAPLPARFGSGQTRAITAKLAELYPCFPV